MENTTTGSTGATLKRLRLDRQRTVKDVHDQMMAISEKAPRHYTAIFHLERAGTSDIDTLSAYADALGITLVEAIEANNLTKITGPMCKGTPGRSKIVA